MVRIVWGVLVILGGLSSVSAGFWMLLFVGALGHGQPVSEVRNFYLSCGFFMALGLVLCVAGSFLIHVGDEGKEDRFFDRLRNLLETPGGRKDF